MATGGHTRPSHYGDHDSRSVSTAQHGSVMHDRASTAWDKRTTASHVTGLQPPSAHHSAQPQSNYNRQQSLSSSQQQQHSSLQRQVSPPVPHHHIQPPTSNSASEQHKPPRSRGGANHKHRQKDALQHQVIFATSSSSGPPTDATDQTGTVTAPGFAAAPFQPLSHPYSTSPPYPGYFVHQQPQYYGRPPMIPQAAYSSPAGGSRQAFYGPSPSVTADAPPLHLAARVPSPIQLPPGSADIPRGDGSPYRHHHYAGPDATPSQVPGHPVFQRPQQAPTMAAYPLPAMSGRPPPSTHISPPFDSAAPAPYPQPDPRFYSPPFGAPPQYYPGYHASPPTGVPGYGSMRHPPSPTTGYVSAPGSMPPSPRGPQPSPPPPRGPPPAHVTKRLPISDGAERGGGGSGRGGRGRGRERERDTLRRPAQRQFTQGSQ